MAAVEAALASSLAALASSGASRHVVAATLAAGLRVVAAVEAKPSAGDPVEAEVKDRLEALRVVLAAQVEAAREGNVQRSARLLVAPEANIMANAARHVFAEPFRQLTPSTVRRAQRGRRRSQEARAHATSRATSPARSSSAAETELGANPVEDKLHALHVRVSRLEDLADPDALDVWYSEERAPSGSRGSSRPAAQAEPAGAAAPDIEVASSPSLHTKPCGGADDGAGALCETRREEPALPEYIEDIEKARQAGEDEKSDVIELHGHDSALADSKDAPSLADAAARSVVECAGASSGTDKEEVTVGKSKGEGIDFAKAPSPVCRTTLNDLLKHERVTTSIASGVEFGSWSALSAVCGMAPSVRRIGPVPSQSEHPQARAQKAAKRKRKPKRMPAEQLPTATTALVSQSTDGSTLGGVVRPKRPKFHPHAPAGTGTKSAEELFKRVWNERYKGHSTGFQLFHFITAVLENATGADSKDISSQVIESIARCSTSYDFKGSYGPAERKRIVYEVIYALFEKLDTYA